ncbi:hypothetical protein WDU94_009108 [Cyamophila willieti]
MSEDKMVKVFQDSKDTGEYISLTVISFDRNDVQFKIRKETPLVKLMNAYCRRRNIDLDSIRWRHDGDFVSKLDTPEKLGMEDGDEIEIFQEQENGGSQTIELC